MQQRYFRKFSKKKNPKICLIAKKKKKNGFYYDVGPKESLVKGFGLAGLGTLQKVDVQ